VPTLPLAITNGGSWHYAFADRWPAWWLVAAGLAVLAWLVYKHESGTTTPRQRFLLGLLRSAALLLVFAMILRPVRVSEQSHIKDSALVVMVDTSLSMDLRDRYRDPAAEAAIAAAAGIAPAGARSLAPDRQADLNGLTRGQLVARVLGRSNAAIVRELAAKCSPRLYLFSSEPRAAQWPTAGQNLEILVKPEGKTTAIGDCLRQVANDLKGQRVAGVVLITDGRSNAGVDALAAVEEYALNREDPFPVVAVGVGDPAEPKDIEAMQIFGNNTVFIKDFITLAVAISSEGFAGRSARLTIEAGDKVLAAQDVELKDGRLQQVPVRFKIDTPGKYECVAKIAPHPDEITHANNDTPPHLLDVIDRPIQVLLVAEKPTWEYRYLKNHLVRDTSVKVSCLLQSADPDFFQEGTQPVSAFPKSREELFAYDVVVLLGANAARQTEADLANIAAFVENVGGGLLVAAHEDYPPSMFTNTPIEKLLPVVPGPPLYYDPLRERPVLAQSFVPHLTPAGGSHPVTVLHPLEKENERAWAKLPGVFWYYPAQKAKPGASVLLEHPVDGNEHGKYPLVAVQFYRGGRTMYVGLDSTWRWRYMRGDTYFGRFWGQAIRFLSSGRLLGENKRLSIATDRPTYTLGQKVVVLARSLDRFYEPLKLDEIAATLESPDFDRTQIALKAVPGSPGMFRTEFTPAAPGKYGLSATSGAGVQAEASASLVVRMPDFENDSPGMDLAALQKIAMASGGKYFPLAEAARIPGEIEKLREEYVTEEQHDIWDTPWLLLFFAAIVVTEWTVRKRKMLA